MLPLRFKTALQQKYGWDEEKCQKEWDSVLEDKVVPRRNDQYGAMTVCWIEDVKASSGRTLNHSKQVVLDHKCDDDADNLREIKDS